MEQLIERVQGLIIRGVKGETQAFEEAEDYDRIPVELGPYNSIPNMAVFNSEAFGVLDVARRMWALRADNPQYFKTSSMADEFSDVYNSGVDTKHFNFQPRAA